MIKKRIDSFRYAIAGLRYLLQTQPNARIHLLATITVILLGFWLEVNTVEWAALALAIGLVFSAEAFNTAIESIVDLVSPDVHPLAGTAKDVAAGAVLLAAITAAVVGLLVFGPKVVAIVGGG